MRFSKNYLRLLGLLLAVIVVFAACDLLGDEDVLDTDLNGDDDVVVDDGVTVVTDAEMWEFVQEFVTAINVFIAQDPTDVEAVDATMLESYFRFPVYDNSVGQYISNTGELKDFFHQRLQNVMDANEPDLEIFLDAYTATQDPDRADYPALFGVVYPDGKTVAIALYVRIVEYGELTPPELWRFDVLGRDGELGIWIIDELLENWYGPA